MAFRGVETIHETVAPSGDSAPPHDFSDLKEQHRREKRALIARAAATVFATKGHDAASMADIAGEAGVSTSAIYLYFESREDLVFATVLGAIDDLEDRMRRSLDPADDPPSALRRMVSAYHGFYRDRPEDFKLLMVGLDPAAREKASPELGSRYDARALDCLSLLHGVVERGIQEGSFREADPWELTHSIWGAFHGILRLAADQPDPGRFLGFEVEGLVRQATDALIDGIATHPARGSP